MSLTLSATARGVAPSATLKLNAAVAQMKSEGVPVSSLGAGEPDFDTPEHIRKAAIEALNTGKTRYTDVSGIPQLRQAIADHILAQKGLRYDARQIIVGAGAKQVLYHALQAILNPGDEFSFNKIVGERTAEKGYQKAIVYQTGGKSEAEEGGGVCQVASTIYTACLYADLKVTERAPHMFTVTYVQLGMDATIYWGSLDYKFVNSTDHPLRIDASVSGGYVHVKLVGTAPKDKGYDHIVLRHEVVATIQPKMEIDGDKTIITDAGTALDENGNTVNIVVDKDGNKYIKGDMVQYSYVGKTVMAYRDYVDANGNVIKTETLHKDAYQARNTSYKCTPYVEPEVPEEPEPTDPDYPDYPDEPDDPDDPMNPWD